MPNVLNVLKVLDDRFTPVRDTNARLLGVIPRIPDNADMFILGTNGAAFELRAAAQVCVCVNPDDPLQSTHYLNGFIPVENAKSRDTRSPSPSDGEDPDLAVGV